MSIEEEKEESVSVSSSDCTPTSPAPVPNFDQLEEDDERNFVRKNMQTRVLLVDDEPFNFIPFKNALKKLGVKYDCACSGQEALNKYQQRIDAF